MKKSSDGSTNVDKGVVVHRIDLDSYKTRSGSNRVL